MKHFLALTLVVLATAVFFVQGSNGREIAEIADNEEPAERDPRGFISLFSIFSLFNLSSFTGSDPCTNTLFQILNVTDAKCSLSCYIQAGLQQGGYCDNGVCQCNQIG